MGEAIRITRAVQTSIACPSQWDLWTSDGSYFYARYRHGCGELHQYEDENWVGAGWRENIDETRPGWGIRGNVKHIRKVAEFQTEDEWDGFISLEEFAVKTGIEIAPDAYTIGFGEHLRDELIKEGMTMFLEMGDDEPDPRQEP
jgi:hypothetical protein